MQTAVLHVHTHAQPHAHRLEAGRCCKADAVNLSQCAFLCPCQRLNPRRSGPSLPKPTWVHTLSIDSAASLSSLCTACAIRPKADTLQQDRVHTRSCVTHNSSKASKQQRPPQQHLPSTTSTAPHHAPNMAEESFQPIPTPPLSHSTLGSCLCFFYTPTHLTTRLVVRRQSPTTRGMSVSLIRA